MFQLSAEPQSQWEIIDLNGNVLKTGTTAATVTEIGVAEFPQGIYFVRVQTRDGGVSSVRLCVL